MRSTPVIFTLLATVAILIAESGNHAGFSNISGAPAGRAASPFDFGGLTCNVSGCHTSYPLGSKTGWITSNIPGIGYTPGQTYTITATASSPNRIRFGFEITPQTATGATAGTVIITDIQQTKLAASPNTRWITHTLTGSLAATSGTKSWTFDWTAPASGAGNVTFYGAFNCANNSSSVFGDSIFTSQLVVPENPTAIWDAARQNLSFNVYPIPAGDNLFVHLKVNEQSAPRIELSDITGKIIAKISDSPLDAGAEYTFDINTSEILAGIYFVRIVNGSVIVFKKIIIL